MPLMFMKVGDIGQIKRVGGKIEQRQHLAELGFVVGSTLSIVQALNGSLIVQIKESRIGLDRDLASKIEVEV